MENCKTGKKELIPAIIWLAFGILIAIESYDLELGTFRNPGPGMMPFSLGIALILLSIPLLAHSVRGFSERLESGEGSIWAEVNFWMVGLIIAALLAYGLTLEKVGFVVTAFYCLALMFKVISMEKLSKVLLLTSVVVTSAYLLFVIVLKVEMPSFPWDIFF